MGVAAVMPSSGAGLGMLSSGAAVAMRLIGIAAGIVTSGTAAVAASLVVAITSEVIDMAATGMAGTFPVASGSGLASGLGMTPFTPPSIRRTGTLTLTLTLTMLHPW